MLTAPLAVASSDTSSFPSPPPSGTSLASTRFLLEREEELPLTLETDTCADGLGDNFSLRSKKKNVLRGWEDTVNISGTGVATLQLS